MGNSELGFQMKTCNLEMHSARDFTVAVPGNNGAVTNLSYSLDKGLDEYEEIKKAQNTFWLTEANITKQRKAAWNLAHVGSEPILTQNLYNKMIIRKDHDTASSSDEAQKWYLQNWQAHGPAPICSDDDTDALHNPMAMPDQSFSNAYMEINKSREGNVQQNGLNMDDMQMRSQNEDGSSFSWDHNALEENSSSLATVHYTTNTEDSPCMNIKNSYWEADVNQTVNKGIIENGGTVIPDWCIQGTEAFHSLQTEFPAGEQDLNALPVVIPDTSSTTASLKNDKDVRPVEDGVFSNASVVRESCCEDNSELERLVGFRNMLENPILDSVLTRTEALARRTASFNLVRTRHSSSLEDGPS
jgi:hypothetical protein